MNTFLYIAYHVVALFYLASGCILLTCPRIIEKQIPKWFPFLHERHLRRVSNGINLIIVGIVLLIVGYLLVERSVIGLYLALLLSALEVYLSITFYWKKKETFSAAYHFVIHILVVGFLFYAISATRPMNYIAHAFGQNLASVFSTLTIK